VGILSYCIFVLLQAAQKCNMNFLLILLILSPSFVSRDLRVGGGRKFSGDSRKGYKKLVALPSQAMPQLKTQTY
jgi:hypothetical protein